MKYELVTPAIREILHQPTITEADATRLLALVKKSCYRIYNKALRDGVLVRPEFCQVCGLKKAAHGHHKSYLQPLAVTWLCEQHHGFIHSKSLLQDFDVIAPLLGISRAAKIRKLMLPPRQRVSLREQLERPATPKKPVVEHQDWASIRKTCTGKWCLKLIYCRKGCLEIQELCEEVKQSPPPLNLIGMTRTSRSKPRQEQLSHKGCRRLCLRLWGEDPSPVFYHSRAV